MSPFNEIHNACKERVDQQLASTIESLPPLPTHLKEVMGYALLGQGKRVRPLLIDIVAETLKVTNYKALADMQTAIECIHAYSLVHDDLPAMDDDATRRGMPTCHVKFDEGMAILAGDALQTLAFDLIVHSSGMNNSQKVLALSIITNASGYKGMCGGQAIDLSQTDKPITQDTLEMLHRLKTGALLDACIQLPLILLSNIQLSEKQHLITYGRTLGLAFQVQDDILDVIGDSATLGKPSGSDQSNHKSTFPALMGLQGAQDYLDDLLQQCLHACEQLPYNTQTMEDFALYITKRNF